MMYDSERNARGPRKRVAAVIVTAAAGAAILVGGSAAVGAGSPGATATPGGPSVAPNEVTTTTPASPPQSVEPPVGTVPKVTSRQRIAMPLDAVMTSMSDIKQIKSATNLKARDCMRSLGFGGWTADTVTTSKPSDYQETDLLDYLDPASVAQSGYPQTLIDKGATALAQKNSSVPRPSKEELQAFTGAATRTAAGVTIPPGGCLEDGARAVKGGVADLPVDPRALAADAKFDALHDSRMQQTFAEWSACMAQSGLHYDGPISAQNDLRWGQRTAATPASTEEKNVAAIDASCQQKINLVGTYKALEIAYQQRQRNTNGSKLTEAGTIFRTWIANAKAINTKG
jgi:hypothetical protein